MRSNSSCDPSAIPLESLNFPRSSMVLKMFSAGGQVPAQIVAPASASALAMDQPKPPSSATPAMRARFPRRSMLSMRRASYTTQRDPNLEEVARTERYAEPRGGDHRWGLRGDTAVLGPRRRAPLGV